MKLFVGIDGGGTKTEFLVCDENGTPLIRFRKGPGNPVDIGIDNCMAVLESGIREIKEVFPDIVIQSVYAGLAGGISGNNRQLVYDGLKALLPAETMVGNSTDALNQLLYECPGQDAGAVIAGTGTVGMSKKAEEVRFFGGYGYLLDRGGSGYDYGRDALYHALCDADGRRERTLIRQLLEEELGDIRKRIPEIYAKGKPYIASFAPVVFRAYKQGDKVAEEIIRSNTKELANLFNSIAAHQAMEVCQVVLAGSVFGSFEIIKKYLDDYLESEFRFILSDAAPVYGTVMQAAVQAGVQDIRRFKENLTIGLLKSDKTEETI